MCCLSVFVYPSICLCLCVSVHNLIYLFVVFNKKQKYYNQEFILFFKSCSCMCFMVFNVNNFVWRTSCLYKICTKKSCNCCDNDHNNSHLNDKNNLQFCSHFFGFCQIYFYYYFYYGTWNFALTRGYQQVSIANIDIMWMPHLLPHIC